MNERKGFIIPAVMLALCVLYLARAGMTPKPLPVEPNLDGFGRLPVVYQGRVKPFDTLARNTLMLLSDREAYTDAEGKKQPAVRWLLDVMTDRASAAQHKVFRIADLQLLNLLGLEERPGFRYGFEEFRKSLGKLDEETARAHKVQSGSRDAHDNNILQLSSRIRQFEVLMAAHSTRADLTRPEALRQEAIRQQSLSQFPVPHAIPPLTSEDEWQPFMKSLLMASMSKQKEMPATWKFLNILSAWKQQDVAAFNKSLAEYDAFLAQAPPADTERLGFETFFNHFAPFYQCSILYVLAFLLCCFSWIGWPQIFNRAALWVMGLTFLIHTFAIGSRIYISGYPPVTNLYSSAIFIGWGFTAMGLLIELWYRIGVGNLLAAVSGFITLIIAHNLSGDGDTMEMMQAVLDTKFWLTTHVITVTLGYSATFFAGAFAIYYIVSGVLTKALTKEQDQTVSRITYGIICFALLLSFVGTVLGGLWADDSWGRFWGWDPKENGALMIVLWNTVVLHARWAGMIRNRGLAVMAIFGNIITAWSWFGVNQLSVGLHSYGFTNSATMWLFIFVASQLLLMGLGLIPRSYWASFRSTDAGKTVSAPVGSMGD